MFILKPKYGEACLSFYDWKSFENFSRAVPLDKYKVLGGDHRDLSP